MLELHSLFETLVRRGQSAYQVIPRNDGLWKLDHRTDAKLVRFTGNLGVYYDDKQGYDIVRIDRFSENQLILQA